MGLALGEMYVPYKTRQEKAQKVYKEGGMKELLVALRGGATELSLPPLRSTKGFSEFCERLLLLARSFIPGDVSLNLITLGLKW